MYMYYDDTQIKDTRCDLNNLRHTGVFRTSASDIWSHGYKTENGNQSQISSI
jgi:hypothetical protein